MPHLLVRGVSPDRLRSISGPLVSELAQLCQCPADDVTLDCLHTTAVFEGDIVPSFPFVEVAWFDRGAEIRNRFAEIVDSHIRKLGINELEVAFRVFPPDSYYINGQPAGSSRAEETAALRQQVESLREDNRRLRGQLHKTSRKPSESGKESSMSSKLRDALRE